MILVLEIKLNTTILAMIKVSSTTTAIENKYLNYQQSA